MEDLNWLLVGVESIFVVLIPIAIKLIKNINVKVDMNNSKIDDNNLKIDKMYEKMLIFNPEKLIDHQHQILDVIRQISYSQKEVAQILGRVLDKVDKMR